MGLFFEIIIKESVASALCSSRLACILFGAITNLIIFSIVAVLFPNFLEWLINVNKAVFYPVVLFFGVLPGIIYAMIWCPPKWAKVADYNNRLRLRTAEKLLPPTGFGNYLGASVTCPVCSYVMREREVATFPEKDQEGYDEYFAYCPKCCTKFQINFW